MPIYLIKLIAATQKICRQPITMLFVREYLPLFLFFILLLWQYIFIFHYRINFPTGTYIAVLGCMVVIMTIWPPEGKWGKAFWLFVILIFTGLEIQSIYQDREEYDNRHAVLVSEERAGFKELLGYAKTGMEAQQKSFSSLIKRQEELFHRQEKLATETLEKVKEREGSLFPDNLPNPVTRCNVPPRKQSLYFAGGAAWNMRFPYSVFKIHDEDVISLDQDDKGGFLISAKIFDDRGDLVVNIRKNKFLATYAASYIERTKSSIIVYDRRGKVALSVRFVNPYSIEVAGNFYSRDGVEINGDDKKIIIGTATFSGNCFNGGSGFLIMP